MTGLMRTWRQFVPSRCSELLAVVSLTTCCLLFLHTSHLQSQLRQYTTQQLSAAETGSNSRQLVSAENYIVDSSRRADPVKALSLSHEDPMSLNNTQHHAKLTLLFNRVPKVGSQSTMELLRALSYKNGFTFHRDRPQKVENIKLTTREQKRLVQLVDVFRPPSVYVKHVCYVNFTMMINDYETCVLSGDRECQYVEGDERPDFAQLTEFFCGQDTACTGFNTAYAMQKAKENVEKHYAVVGLLEEMNMTLTVLEHYVPRFFKGAKSLYWNEVRRFSKVNQNIYKPKVQESVKDVVRKNFTREMEFYDFCKQRLHRQYAALNLPPHALNDLGS
ncbi:heparan sulfate 2-O-sulfotransferase pipe [Hyalella azteca]|uniref:Heparan sulfate 2-O-sulfotransferase pipe n=1 Tax=Hyalella azteca TaxID=294128 RepID=A0A979FFJ0_HYAAZ|nr:heparan sulfate 2-O-sulfotransferase pipe [Hyalella azteca]